MKPQTLLANLGYKSARDGSGRYRDPVTERLIKRETALNRAAKFYGYTSYGKAKEAYSSKAYARIVGKFAVEAGVPNDYALQQLFRKAWNVRDKECSKELAQLLKYVQKINKYKAMYCAAL